MFSTKVSQDGVMSLLWAANVRHPVISSTDSPWRPCTVASLTHSAYSTNPPSPIFQPSTWTNATLDGNRLSTHRKMRKVLVPNGSSSHKPHVYGKTTEILKLQYLPFVKPLKRVWKEFRQCVTVCDGSHTGQGAERCRAMEQMVFR